jgi:hypothetical protein
VKLELLPLPLLPTLPNEVVLAVSLLPLLL